MSPRIFFSKGSIHRQSSNFPLCFREAIVLLFPTAVPFDWPDRALGPPSSFFLREGENILWVELVSSPFTRNDISDYLAKARQIQSACPSAITGILAAPKFEAGIIELLEFIRIPIRLLRYQEAFPLGSSGRSNQETALWLEEITTDRPSDKIQGLPMPFKEDSVENVSTEPPGTSWNRLSREELREFIQLELDVASRTPVP